MKLEYILIAAFALVFSFIFLVYYINTLKMKKKSQPKAEKSKKPEEAAKPKKEAEQPKKDDGGKVEVQSEVLTEKPVDTAKKEANIEYEINAAFEKINDEKEEYERINQKVGRVGRLQVDRSDFNREIKSTRVKSNRNVLKSETAEIGHEGPTKRSYPSRDDKKDLNEATDPTVQTIADEINNMSPEAKAILINDILNNKYS